MKKLLTTLIFLAALPVAALAEEHSMQNSNPSPAEPVKEIAAPEHSMQNSNPSPKQELDQAVEKMAKPEHTMQNSNPSPKEKKAKAKAPDHVMNNN